MKRAGLFLIVAVLLASPTMLAAEECPTSYDIDSANGTHFGRSVAFIGDIGSPGNSAPDGYDDFIVGAYKDASGRGRVYVYSGADGTEIRSHTGPFNNDGLGYSVSSAGDFNGDGRPDYIIGGYDKYGDRSGRVEVHDGITGDLLFGRVGNPGELLGYSVTVLGDYNNDGKDEVIVSSPTYSDGGYPDGGRILLFEGGTSTGDGPQAYINGTSDSILFGYYVTGVGDIDNDSTSDFAVCSRSGDIIVYSGGNWYDTLLTAPGSAKIAGVGDVNGDGRPDFVVGYLNLNNGNAVVFSGAGPHNGRSADTLFTLTVPGGRHFGQQVSGGGLIDADMVPDILVTELGGGFLPNRNSAVHVFSGADSSLLYTLDGGLSGNSFGDALASDGDTDGDSLANILVGQPNSGHIYIFSCTDGDGDGVFDLVDNCPLTYNPGQEDGDGDEVGDVCDNCPDNQNQDQSDTDNDGIGDVCDNCPDDANPGQEDGDSDDVGTVCDNCPTDANTNQADTDDDDVGNVCDNCPDTANINQADGDSDGVGNVCDNCPDVANTSQEDLDTDGVGDSCDNCLSNGNSTQADWDEDGIGNACECTGDPFQCCEDGWPDRVPGDVDTSGSVNVADLTYLVAYLFSGGPEPIPFELAGDVDCDTLVTVADLTDLVAYLFSGGSAPQDCCADPAGRTDSPNLALRGATIPVDGVPVAIITSVYDGVNTTFEINSSVDLLGVQLDMACDDDAIITGLSPEVQVFSSHSQGLARIGLLDLSGQGRITVGVTTLLTVTGEAFAVVAVGSDENSHTVPISVERIEPGDNLPESYSLSQNFPNPFNPVTEISFSLPSPSDVTLEIFNVMGQKVATLVNRRLEAGNHSYTWDGSEVASGVYLYRFQADDYSASRKMVLMK